jgi:GAF domain-containing protein
VADLTSDAELRTILKALGPTSEIVVPLRNHGSMLGSLTLLLSSTERQLGRAELALAEELALCIAAAADSSLSLQ